VVPHSLSGVLYKCLLMNVRNEDVYKYTHRHSMSKLSQLNVYVYISKQSGSVA